MFSLASCWSLKIGLKTFGAVYKGYLGEKSRTLMYNYTSVQETPSVINPVQDVNAYHDWPYDCEVCCHTFITCAKGNVDNFDNWLRNRSSGIQATESHGCQNCG